MKGLNFTPDLSGSPLRRLGGQQSQEHIPDH
jgi:hypothetical protein